MKSELHQKDPSTLTREEATSLFQQKVQEIMSEYGITDVSAAWAKARALNPTLYARLCQGRQPVPESLTNDDTMALPVPSGPAKAFYCGQLKLPPIVPDDVFAAAWRANRNRFPSPNYQDVFLAVVVALAKKYDRTIPVARREAIDAYPLLAKAAGEVTE